MIGIYKITNKINGKCYIGQSIHIERRWYEHKTKAYQQTYELYNSPLSRAFRKYGIDNFLFEVVEQCTIEELDDKEIYWINYYESYLREKGYNQTLGGDHHFKMFLTPQQVEEIIILLKTTLLPQEEIAIQFNVNQSMISRINNGFYWHKENEKYPIRKSVQILKAEQKKKQKEEQQSHLQIEKRYCINRDKLKQLIRSTPFTIIGKQFGVTDNAIRKWCNSYKLPKTKKEINSYSDEEWEKI